MSEKPTVSFSGYLPNGLKTYWTLVVDGTQQDYDNVLAYTNNLLAKGLSLEAPGLGKLEAGHKREQINGILRRKDQKNSDGTISPTFDLYPDNPALGRRCLIVNLDTPEEITEFETVTGYKVNDFKVYVAQQLNRKDDPSDYQEYSKPIDKPLWVVFKDNPAYDPTAEKKKRQHLFIRWETATPTPPPPAPAAVGNPTPTTPPAVVGNPDVDYGALEAEERRKARTAHDNELITIYRAKYAPMHNGQGAPRWEAMAHDVNDTQIPVVVWDRGEWMIKKAGYQWTQTNIDNVAIPVITELVGGERRIKSVQAPDGTFIDMNSREPAKIEPDANTWIFDRAKLLNALSKDNRVKHLSYQERGATVDKMFKDGEYDKVSAIGGAIEMTVSRLQVHMQQREQQTV